MGSGQKAQSQKWYSSRGDNYVVTGCTCGPHTDKFGHSGRLQMSYRAYHSVSNKVFTQINCHCGRWVMLYRRPLQRHQRRSGDHLLTRISNYIHYEACEEITHPFPTFMQQLAFGNGSIISPNPLMDVRILIHFGDLSKNGLRQSAW